MNGALILYGTNEDKKKSGPSAELSMIHYIIMYYSALKRERGEKYKGG